MSSARDTALEALVPVERLVRGADPEAVADLLETRRGLEAIAGRTVTRGRAARFLGVTQTTVDRWIEDGGVPTVLDPGGRIAVPTRELVRLRVEADDERRRGAQRPLGAVIRRRRQAAAALPFTAIAPPRLRDDLRSTGHRRAEVVDLAVHRLIAGDLTAREVAIARWQLERSAADGLTHPRWAERWRGLLGRSVDDVRDAITADSAEAARLRQTSPFKGLAGHEERRALLAALGALA